MNPEDLAANREMVRALNGLLQQAITPGRPDLPEKRFGGRVFRCWKLRTMVPDAERLQPLIAALVPKLTAEDAVTKIREKAIPYTNTGGIRSTFNLTPANEVNARDLVLYILPASSNPNELEFHLTWEIEIRGAPVQRAYLDAISGDVIAAE